MSDVSEAPTQAEIAESLLGEPEAESTVETTGTEQQDIQQEEAPTVEAAEEQDIETAEDWLPSEQDKVFSDDVLLKYAERYQKDEEWLSDPLNRQLLIDKLNSDIFLRQQQEQYEQEPTEEYETEAEAEPTREQAQPHITREQYFQNLDRLVAERTDPEVAKQFHADFLKSFGVPDAEIQKIPPQQAMQFTQTASKYMLNLVNTFLGDMLGAQLNQQIAQAFPGFGEMYERSAYAMAWDRVRNSNAQYQSLPAYGSKEFSRTLREASAKIPGFEDMQFTGRDGKPLSMMENAARKYAMLAQVASGQSLDPQLVQQAAQAQVRAARRADVRRTAANLGSGQSRAASGRTNSSRFQSNQDLFDEDTMDLYQREHGRL